ATSQAIRQRLHPTEVAPPALRLPAQPAAAAFRALPANRVLQAQVSPVSAARFLAADRSWEWRVLPRSSQSGNSTRRTTTMTGSLSMIPAPIAADCSV